MDSIYACSSYDLGNLINGPVHLMALLILLTIRQEYNYCDLASKKKRVSQSTPSSVELYDISEHAHFGLLQESG